MFNAAGSIYCTVSVFLEKYLLPVTAAVSVLVVFTNPMGLDWRQRTSGGLALLCIAYFVGHTLQKRNDMALSQQNAIVQPQQPIAPGPALALEDLLVTSIRHGYSWRFQLANPQSGIAAIDGVVLNVLSKSRHPESDRKY